MGNPTDRTEIKWEETVGFHDGRPLIIQFLSWVSINPESVLKYGISFLVMSIIGMDIAPIELKNEIDPYFVSITAVSMFTMSLCYEFSTYSWEPYLKNNNKRGASK